MNNNPELNPMPSSEAAEQLAISDATLGRINHELHRFAIPDEHLRTSGLYVMRLANSQEWRRNRDDRTEAALAFAASDAAIDAVHSVEKGYESRIIKALYESDPDERRFLTAKYIAQLLHVSPSGLSNLRRRTGMVAAESRGQNRGNTIEDFRTMYGWQRPASMDEQYHPQSKGGLVVPGESAKQLPTMPTILGRNEAAGRLEVDQATMHRWSDLVHTLRTPITTRFSEDYIAAAALKLYYHSARRMKPALETMAGEEAAVTIMDSTEAKHAAAIDEAYAAFGDPVPDYVAAHLLGLNRESIGNLRDKGHVAQNARITRDVLESLYSWHRPGSAD